MKIRHLDVSYSQVSVFLSALQDPFNDWSDDHVRQGFAWRPGSVSFATIKQSGQLQINVVMGGPGIETSTAERIISVPFEVDDAGAVDIASISDGQAISLPAGKYRLTFEHGISEDDGMWCCLSFESVTEDAQAELIRLGDGLAQVDDLLMEARPAI